MILWQYVIMISWVRRVQNQKPNKIKLLIYN
jgi:hypothetical protein